MTQPLPFDTAAWIAEVLGLCEQHLSQCSSVAVVSLVFLLLVGMGYRSFQLPRFSHGSLLVLAGPADTCWASSCIFGHQEGINCADHPAKAVLF